MDVLGPAPRRRGMTPRLRFALAALAVLVVAAPAVAHRLAPSLLSIDERADGTLEIAFKRARQQPSGARIEPELPAVCTATGEPRVEADAASVTVRWTADCGPEGLVGERVGVSGLAESATNALLRISLRDGRSVQAVLHGGATTSPRASTTCCSCSVSCCWLAARGSWSPPSLPSPSVTA